MRTGERGLQQAFEPSPVEEKTGGGKERGVLFIIRLTPAEKFVKVKNNEI